MSKEIIIPIHFENLDEAVEKANRLVELLREAAEIVNSLSGKTNGGLDALQEGGEQEKVR